MQVVKFTEGDKLFLRAFLLDATKNLNEWKVVSASIPQNIRTAIGMPLTLEQKFDHPEWLHDDAWTPQEEFRRNFQHQQKFAIGVIRDVVEKDGRWDAIIEVTDPLAKEAIEKEEIPFFVSPRILHDPSEPEDAIQKWMLFHLAVVDKPAFGDKAKISSACYGEAGQCQIALKNAKKEECGFCVKTQLLKLITNADSSHSSHNFARKKNELMENSPSSTTVDLSGYVPKVDYDKLVAEVSAKNAAFEQAKKAYDERLAAIELENTTNKITAVLSAKIADKEELAKKVKYFVDAKVAPEVVAEAFKLVPDVKTQAPTTNESTFTGKPTDASAKGPSYADYVAYERRLIKA